MAQTASSSPARAAADSVSAETDAGIDIRDQGEAKKSYRQILGEEITEGTRAIKRPTMALFLSGLSAGLDIGFSLFLMAVMKTKVRGQLPESVTEMLVAAMYSVGFIFVVLGRTELFTEHTTLAVLPVLDRRESVSALARLWVIVYVANFCGATIFAAGTVLIGPRLNIIDPHVLGEIAARVCAPPGLTILISAIFAGWLMGLLGWLVTASRDTISQIAIVAVITTAIGFSHLHHAVVGSVEVMAGLFAKQGITPSDIGHFQLWTTIGNAIGGTVFVAVLKYGHATWAEPTQVTPTRKKKSK